MMLMIAMFHSLAIGAEPSPADKIPSFNMKELPATEPVDLSLGPQLFIDDYLVAKMDDLTRTTHAPERYSDNPILGWQQGTTQPYLTVVRDRETGRFRMWYNRDIGPGGTVAYAESDDGMHWRTPNLGIMGDDNRLFEVSSSFQSGFGSSVIDKGPDYPDKSKRFKIAWWGQTKPRPDGDPGMRVAFSADGLHWTPYEGNPVLNDFSDGKLDDPRRPHGAGDIIDVYFDPIRRQYGVLLKTPAMPSDGLSTGAKASSYIRRLVSASSSADFIHWKDPWRVIIPEPRDEGVLEFYSVGGTFARGGLLIGFVRMLHDDYPAEPGGPAEGIGYTVLVTSRDGVHWERHSDIFFDRSPAPNAWDRAMTWVGCALPVEEKLYLYYGGYQRGHKIEPKKERQLGLAIMPMDRFVSLDASGDKKGGRLVTTLLKPASEATRLVLNADASKGSIRVRMLDEAEGVFPGADFSEAVTGDGLALAGKGLDLAKADGKPFRLEFQIENARLYGFDVVSVQ